MPYWSSGNIPFQTSNIRHYLTFYTLENFANHGKWQFPVLYLFLILMIKYLKTIATKYNKLNLFV